MASHSENFNEEEDIITHGSARREADASHRQYPDQYPACLTTEHAHSATSNVNIRPAQNTAPAQVPAASTSDKGFEMNKWLLERSVGLQPSFSSNTLPLSVKDFMNDNVLDQRFKSILANATTNVSRGNVRHGLFPFKYVFRGDDLKCAPMNSLTISDHCWAIFRMIKDDSAQADIKPYLVTHIDQILEDTGDYSWPGAIRLWSNEVFSRVAEGRFSNGWASTNEIQLLRISISQTSTAKLNTPSDLGKGPRQNQQVYSNEQLHGGPPCMNFNSAKGCPLQSSHFTNGQKLLHICAFCLINAAAACPHSEIYCRNRQRQNATAGPHFQ